ncbi:MAG: TldD/PmbA family protein [Deltaproteobacteria bacterium]|nr:TldD/PmbA family protein [Deltaproteobacteria bacterium]
MFGQLLALEMVHTAVAEAIRLGATFADARFEVSQREDVAVEDMRLLVATLKAERGLGLRVLVNGAWGFASLSQPTRHEAVVLARRAVEVGRAASMLQKRPVTLVPEEPRSALYRTPMERDPLGVPLEEKVGLLQQINARMRRNPLIKMTRGRFAASRTKKLYVSSEGAEIDQDLTWTSIGYEAGASDGHDFQIRSFPSSHGGAVAGRGYELVTRLPLLEKAEEVAEEAVAQLKADPCPADTTALILGSTQLALQLHESIGHPSELDRVLGFERSFAGTSFLTPDRLGSLELGSSKVNVYADAQLEGGVGTFGFDDEGVEAQRVELVVGGKLTGYLSSRDTAHRVGLQRSSGSMRGASWSSIPLVRMTNVCMAPGDAGGIEDLIADTKSGVFVDSNRSWSIDDRREHFQFGCEVAWEIKNGKRTRRLKNPVYSGVTPRFWSGCDAVCGPAEWEVIGVMSCGKGEPLQLLPVGHACAPARFLEVALGSTRFEAPVIDSRDALPRLSHPEVESPSRIRARRATNPPKRHKKRHLGAKATRAKGRAR